MVKPLAAHVDQVRLTRKPHLIMLAGRWVVLWKPRCPIERIAAAHYWRDEWNLRLKYYAG